MRASRVSRLPLEAMSIPISRAQTRERTFAAAAATPVIANPADAAQITRNTARAMSGQCAKLRRHQGSAARRSSSRNTRDSNDVGARRSGSSRRVRSNTRSNRSFWSACSLGSSGRSLGSFAGMSILQAAGGDAAGLQKGQQRRAGAPYIGFDLGKRGMQFHGDLLVGELLEVIQDQRQPLMFGEPAQRAVDEHTALLGAQIREQCVRLRY